MASRPLLLERMGSILKHHKPILERFLLRLVEDLTAHTVYEPKIHPAKEVGKCLESMQHNSQRNRPLGCHNVCSSAEDRSMVELLKNHAF